MAKDNLEAFVKKTTSLMLALVLMVPMAPVKGHADDMDDAYQEDAAIIKGDVYSTPVSGLERVSVTDPTIADITDANETKVDVIGKKVGQTTLFIWDSGGKRVVTIRVFDENLSTLRDRVISLLKSSGITEVTVKENLYEGKIVLSGTLPEDKMKTLDKAIEPFENKIINLVQKENIEDLVQIDMQVTEVKNTLQKELGVDWTTGSQTISDAGVVTEDSGSLTPAVGEIIPRQDGSLGDLFKLGKFYRFTNSALIAKLNLLIEEGKAKILSKPRLVVKNGKEARVLVGGEIPILTTDTTSSGTSQKIVWKEYGFTLSITPAIQEGKINILMMSEIRDVDSSYSGGKAADAPAFVTRTAQTQLLLDDKQTIVLAGMIKKREDHIDSRVPFLGKIPILGLLFRSSKTQTPTEESEIVISLTPTILKASARILPKPVVQAVAPVVEEISVATVSLNDPQRNNVDLPVIRKNAAMNRTMVPSDIKAYATLVQEKLSSSIAYPLEARDNGWQGTVKLGMVIRKDGSLKEAFVAETSGYDVFDKDAVNTAYSLAPYAAFPNDIREEQVTLTIPIVYSMDGALKSVAKR